MVFPKGVGSYMLAIFWMYGSGLDQVGYDNEEQMLDYVLDLCDR